MIGILKVLFSFVTFVTSARWESALWVGGQTPTLLSLLIDEK